MEQIKTNDEYLFDISTSLQKLKTAVFRDVNEQKFTESESIQVDAAISTNNPKFVKELESNGVDLSKEKGKALLTAIALGRNEVALHLLDKTRINPAIQNGAPLIVGAMSNNIQMLFELSERLKKRNGIDHDNAVDALSTAVCFGQKEAVDVLLQEYDGFKSADFSKVIVDKATKKPGFCNEDLSLYIQTKIPAYMSAKLKREIADETKQIQEKRSRGAFMSV